ncbi:MAG: aldehyde ferredoxin oxidoreductase N-terminal domain-containing protein, partial [Candidatus Thorarchaeota archaeon]
MTLFGYSGNILTVDLTNNQIQISKEVIKDLRNFIGGFGMNCKLFAELVQPNLNPLSPENPIIIGTGPLVGTITPGASRTVAISKFPASNAIANSCGSMSFGFNLKQAGYDHIIIQGKSSEPCYLFIDNNDIQLYNASKLWGNNIIKTTNKLKKEHGSSGVIAIGQAGENLIKSSITLIDKTSTLGRGGLGALMGFKKLKAIVVKGSNGIRIAEPKTFNNIYQELRDRIKRYPQRDSWIELGMLRSLPVGIFLAAKGEKEKASQCSERTYLKKMKRRRIACPSCPMADKDILNLSKNESSQVGCYTSSVINPLMLFGLSGLETYDQAIQLFNIINDYGLDSLTMTAMFEFINQMISKKILTENEISIEWKENIECYKKLLDLIKDRTGFGEIIAEGWNKLTSYNSDFLDYVSYIKGLDIVFEPRLLKLGTMEFEQVVNPKGAHVASGGSPTYVGAGNSIDKMLNHFNRMGIPYSAQERLFTPPKKEMRINVGRMTRYSEDWYTMLSSLGLCARAQINRFYNHDLITELYNAVTGLDRTNEELRKAAERSWNLLKLLNVKEGFSRKDDQFPEEWFKILKYGQNELKLKDFYGATEITKQIANQLLDDYYDERGWNKLDGTPKYEKL